MDTRDSEARRARRRRSWNRFLDQKTTPQRLLIALAGIVAALVTIGGFSYAVLRWLDDDDGGGGPSAAVAVEGRLAQGSSGADDLVEDLLAAEGGRLDLDVVVDARDGTPDGSIYSFLPLWYNCRGEPVGDDSCNQARLEFGDDDPPATVSPPGVHFRGTYAVTIVRGTIFGTDVDIRVDDIAS